MRIDKKRREMKKLKYITSRFQYISDLHLEMRRKIPNIPVIANQMILAGDIGNPFHDSYEEFLTLCSNNYKFTFVVSGNHEYWNDHGIDATNEKIEEITSKLGNVYYMNKRKIETENVCILGCTLWSKLSYIPPETRKVGDDINIFDSKGIILGPDGLDMLHKKDVRWLTKTLESCKKDTIVISHHLPTYDLLHRKYNNERNLQYLNRYYTNLEHLIKHPVKVWIGGHSHCSMKINIGNTFLGINAYGYPNQYEKFYSKHKVTTFHI